MKLIPILNFYGMKNIGDGAIYQSAIQIINDTVSEPVEIHTHTVDTDIPTNITDLPNIKNTNLLSPYGFAISSKGEPLSMFKKLVNFVKILVTSILIVLAGKINPNWLPKTGFYYYITSIYKSDVVFNIGGGYLRTKDSYKDFFGLILTLLPIFIAKIYNKPLLFLPMSFGNFADMNHENLCVKAIKGTTFIARDDISFEELKKHSQLADDPETSLICIPDLALFLYDDKNKAKSDGKFANPYMVLTARDWMAKDKQEKYEDALIRIIDYIYEKYKVKTIFLPMVHNDIEDNDHRVANRIQKAVKDKESFSIKKVETPEEVQEVLDGAKFSICTRMHSAILSATVLTPHIGIAYEHKMHGYMALMGLKDWVTDIKTVTYEDLKSKVDKILDKEEYNSYFDLLKVKIKETQNYKDNLFEIIGRFI